MDTEQTARELRSDGTSAEQERPAVAWLPILSAAAVSAAVLILVVGRYDYHRDELYFRILRPAWGYVDQPPFTPFLARLSTGVFGDSLWALRLPAILCLVALIIVVALTTREFGGRAGAQALSAWGIGFATLPLTFGHILLTASTDMVVWACVLLFATRALLRDEPRWWLAVGAAVGLGLYNKYLLSLLLIGLAVALLLVGPRRVFMSKWLWAGVGIAVVIAAPNLIYQATHDWPQAEMAAGISESKGSGNRAELLPLQVVFLGPTLLPVIITGFVALLRRPRWRPVRAFAVAYVVVLVLVFVTGGLSIYPLGLLTMLFAAGCVPMAEWIGRGKVPRRTIATVLVALHCLTALPFSLPVLSQEVLAETPIPDLNQTIRDQIGWPTLVDQVEAAYREVSSSDGVIVASNYGEAGAIDRYGEGLPTVYSGQNELFEYGPPPQSASVVLAVGFPASALEEWFASCEQVGELDNGLGIDNEEQDRNLAVCREPVAPWAQLWPEFRHLD